MFTSKGLGPYGVERGVLQGGAADSRSKMRPDMMTVEMTAAEQQQYLRHDDDSKFRLKPLSSVMSNGSEEDIALIQNMRKSCKKREDSMKHWRKLSRTMDTMLPHCL